MQKWHTDYMVFFLPFHPFSPHPRPLLPLNVLAPLVVTLLLFMKCLRHCPLKSLLVPPHLLLLNS